MPTETIGKKKLKQSRLPFSPVDPKSQKKRKLSTGSDNECSKVLRTETTSKIKKCNSPEPKEEIEIIDIEEEKVVEEKENLKTKSVEKIVTNVEKCHVEDSNDGVEVLEVIGKSGSASEIGTSTTKQVTKKKVKNVKKPKRKRNSSPEDSPSNIKKLFEDIEKKQDVTPTIKAQDSDMKDLSENKNDMKDLTKNTKEVSDKNELNILRERNEETEPNVSLESNCNTSSSDSSTPISANKSRNDGTKSTISKTPSLRKSLGKKNITPKQKMFDEMKKKKEEERLKLKLQKEQEKKEKDFERQRLKEEKQRKRIEEQEMKDREKEEKKQKREEERQRREEKKEEERQKKEEEKQKREEERLKKEEEKLLAEEEEREKQKKLKAKFAQFFVPKKIESQNQPKEMDKNNSTDNFIHFQVKDNMKIAPVVRRSLSKKQKEMLEESFQEHEQNPINYLQEIKSENYVRRKSSKTFPLLDNSREEEFCEIISDEEEIDGTDVLEVKTSQRKKFRAKFLKFCENSRPAYYGTWCKKPLHISGRKPFGREEIFDYDYDSDEDWEDIENGESLSDSDGEGDDGGKEDANQYEVDNEFFVPHGYLSEGEGEEDDENEEEAEDKEKDETSQKERLKQKQEEFEMEMNQKTKHLKPKVYGCVWLGDRTSHQAYDQLLKILMPHKAVVMFGTCPIELGKELNNHELKENDDDEGHDDDNARKFVKSFPERAMPDLIRLIHGNRHSKLFLMREFSEFWKRKQGEVADSDSGFIAMRKIEPKIQEIGQYGRFSENGISLKYRTWYVSKEIREKYGLEDLSLKNSWHYTLPVKEWKHDPKEEKPDENDDSPSSKCQSKSGFTGTNLITKFTKVLNGEDDKKKLFNVASNNEPQSPCSTDASVSPDNLNLKIANTSDTSDMVATTPCSSGKKKRKKANLTTITKEKTEKSRGNKSIVSMFKNIGKERKNCDRKSSPENKDQLLECITLE